MASPLMKLHFELKGINTRLDEATLSPTVALFQIKGIWREAVEGNFCSDEQLDLLASRIQSTKSKIAGKIQECIKNRQQQYEGTFYGALKGSL